MKSVREKSVGCDWKSAAIRCAAGIMRDVRSKMGIDGLRRSRVQMIEVLEARQLMTATPLITEFVASNQTGLTDEDGNRGDWIEIYNPGAEDVNLSGYHLTNDDQDLSKWTL